MEEKEYRITIPKLLKEMSCISQCTKVAVMLKDKNTVYLMPENQFSEGKLLGIRRLDAKNRMNISKLWYSKGAYTFYLEKGVIYIWWYEA